MAHTTADYKSDVKITWCPGCGDFAVLNALYQALTTLNLDPKDVAVVSGIGCSGRLPIFVNSYGFHGVHGRVLPTAMGVKIGNPKLTVIALCGDGDGLAIGGGHFPHAARPWRSEEHTSELQSLTNLVCRLLLEKKKKIRVIVTPLITRE